MNRTTLKSQVRAYLGTTADDPAFTDAVLEPILQQAYDSLSQDRSGESVTSRRSR
jgi:hypothetical protein